jgi:hypothetical protein
VLATPLVKDVETVRKIVVKRGGAEAKHLLATVVDYHLTIFATVDGDPDDILLMGVH